MRRADVRASVMSDRILSTSTVPGAQDERSAEQVIAANRCLDSPVDRSATDQERTPIAAHEGVLAGGIEALCEHAPAPGAFASVLVPVSVVRVPHAGSTSALTVADTARSGAPVGWWPR